MKNNFHQIALVITISLISTFGCKFFQPKNSTNQRSFPELNWMDDLPERKTINVSAAPYTEPIAKLLPNKIGKYKLIESKSTSGYENPNEAWSAYYILNNGNKYHLYMQNFSNSDQAYSAMRSEVIAGVGGSITKIEPAIKNNMIVGTKVSKISPHYEDTNVCDSEVVWSNSTLAITLETLNCGINAEDFYRQLPF